MGIDATVTPASPIPQPTGIETMSSDAWRATIALRGELDLANAARLRAEINRHLDAGRGLIRIDAADLAFIDSTVIGELIDASERCRRVRGALILSSVRPRIRKLLKITGLDGVLLVDTAGDLATQEPA